MVFSVLFFNVQAGNWREKNPLNYCNNAAPVHIIGIPAGKRQIIHLHFHLAGWEDQINCDVVQLWVARVKSALFALHGRHWFTFTWTERLFKHNFSFLQNRSNKWILLRIWDIFAKHIHGETTVDYPPKTTEIIIMITKCQRKSVASSTPAICLSLTGS